MIFRTEIQPAQPSYEITHQSKLLTIGSCFADVIGSKLLESKFDITNNPFGTIFNPLSTSTLLQTVLDEQPLPDYSYLKSGETWYNYYLHSSINSDSKESLDQTIFQLFSSVNESILNADVLIITLGTAWVYKLVKEEKTVANCHKQPSSLFEKTLLSPEEIIQSFSNTFNLVWSYNPGLKIILTVSPVRHIKDSIELNSVSKSILRYAVYNLVQNYPLCSYFPSFEIMMDDLRDYRFYKEDMIHPTEQAEKYIWNFFSKTFFSPQTIELLKKWEQVRRSLQHIPFNSHSSEYNKFLGSTLKKLQELSTQLNVEEEIKELSIKLKL